LNTATELQQQQINLKNMLVRSFAVYRFPEQVKKLIGFAGWLL